MTDYAAEMDRILTEYRATSRDVRETFIEADERHTRGGGEVFAELRERLRREREEQARELAEAAAAQAKAMEAERAAQQYRPLPNAERFERRPSKPTSRDNVVLPSDWTDEDEAREEGYGPPASWLT
ncbi:MAG: hypothetical protein J2P18_07270 [Nocardia sp.]|nr:hypothetical protein [Nocardia sp.]